MAHKQKAAEERNRNAQDSAPVVAGAMDPDALRQKIQVRAYYRYCERGCALGADLDDWWPRSRKCWPRTQTRLLGNPRHPPTIAARDSACRASKSPCRWNWNMRVVDRSAVMPSSAVRIDMISACSHERP